MVIVADNRIQVEFPATTLLVTPARIAFLSLLVGTTVGSGSWSVACAKTSRVEEEGARAGTSRVEEWARPADFARGGCPPEDLPRGGGLSETSRGPAPASCAKRLLCDSMCHAPESSRSKTE
jgi:hypothetical protein